ncbi:tripartite tricarboxylate transporter substrate binding protein [Polaromonas sp. SM01]|uniref:Bug family tripartite tricarboxylate transporter substrate binding protein n=1 Tax=Polaromonas sp. SM01 TaxID=3085630 RepID=UPI002982B556|nr:tripartite tricarboxylate transporter substrate binding protein [Polaromonas sp. SM01]MDW5443622.1 tripartite tricarboxylate transporter substrate binding protein [Polaromonas sp. SM01]
MRYSFLLKTSVAIACTGLLPWAQAQSAVDKQLSSRPFTIVAPFPPGGPIDTLARILATGLTERYKQPAIVDNRTGANGNIGIDLVKRAAPTGHTLLVVPAGNLTINPTLMPKLGYNVEADFAPVASLAKAPNVLAVNPSLPAKTVAELVALSKAKPDTISYASPGVGSGLHLAGELFKQQSGADILHVAYKGSAPGLNDVLGGTVPMIIGNLPVLLPHIQSGKLRPLAVTDPTRAAALPNVPTLAEAGVPGVAVTSWYGLMAPKGTPAPVLAQLASDVTRIFNTPATQAQLEKQGLSVWIVTEAAFGDVIRKETATWAPIIKSRKIEAQ